MISDLEQIMMTVGWSKIWKHIQNRKIFNSFQLLLDQTSDSSDRHMKHCWECVTPPKWVLRTHDNARQATGGICPKQSFPKYQNERLDTHCDQILILLLVLGEILWSVLQLPQTIIILGSYNWIYSETLHW